MYDPTQSSRVTSEFKLWVETHLTGMPYLWINAQSMKVFCSLENIISHDDQTYLMKVGEEETEILGTKLPDI